MFITFEGGEGSGKSTQVKLLYKYINAENNKHNLEASQSHSNNRRNIANKNNNNALGYTNALLNNSNNSHYINKNIMHTTFRNYEVVLTREPGGTLIADQLRTILLQGKPDKMQAITEALMFLAARSDCWNKIIKPALDNNKIVICDRFHDSTLVYQGICSNIDINLLNDIYKNITNNVFPNRTYLIDIDPIIGLNRSLRTENKDIRFEMKSLEYHQKIRDAYLQIAKNNNRYLIIDGNLPVQEINNIIITDFNNLIN